MMQEDWNNAVKNLHFLMHSNADFLSTIYQISKSNQSLNNQEVFNKAVVAQEMVEETIKKVNDPKIELEFLRTTAHTIQKDFSNVDLSAFVEEREELTQDYAKFRNQFVSLNKSFGDIVRYGPRNSIEETLLVSATAFLEPQEFKKAIITGMQPRKVSDMIDNSKIKQFTDAIMKSKGDDIVKSAEKNENKAMPNILGEKLGIIDSIQQGLENTSITQNASMNDVKAPKTPSVENEKGKESLAR